MKKYELTDIRDGNLRRIRALRDIPVPRHDMSAQKIVAGNYGGWIESEENLSQDGDCWIDINATVCEHARVSENAHVQEHAYVGEHAQVTDRATVSSVARVVGHALIRGDADVSGYANIDGHAWVEGHSTISCNAYVGERAHVYAHAYVGSASKVKGNAHVGGYSSLGGNACVDGNAVIVGSACLQTGAVINSSRDYLVVGPIGSRAAYTTFYRTASDIWVCCGCFNDSIDAFETEVRKTHGDNPHARAYLAAIELAKIQLPEGGEQNLQKLIARWKQELNKQIEYGFGVNELAVTVETIDVLERLLKTTQRKED